MNLRHLSLTRNDLGVKAKNQDHAVRKSPPITSCAVAHKIQWWYKIRCGSIREWRRQIPMGKKWNFVLL